MLVNLFFVIIGIIYWGVLRPRQDWNKNGMMHIIFGGYFTSKFKRNSFAELVQYIYDKTTGRYLWIHQFFRPILVVKDLNLIRQLTVRDFDYFPDHLLEVPGGDYEPLWSKNLFVLKGQKWRDMRAALSPAFTTSKMKTMFKLMNDCAKNFANNFESANSTTTVELKDIFTKYANDVIATCAFGVQCDSVAQKDNQFYLMGKEATTYTGLWKSIKFSIFLPLPKICQLLRITILNKAAGNFFINLVRDTITTREEKKIVRPDMIHLLMEAKNGRLKYEENASSAKETGFATVEESNLGIKLKTTPKEKLTIVDLTAQAFAFFFAGFETISTALCFMGYELATHPDIQQRLFEEIKRTSDEGSGDITYETLNKMKYLDMVIAETLRKWPTAAVVDRICSKAYTIEPEHVFEKPVPMEKGSCIWIPIWGIHHDPQYYPNPELFDPERFNDENKGNIKPYTYLPFGLGPRNCIASRFALMEAKAVFFHLLYKYEIVVIDKTPIPLTLSKRGFLLSPEGGFWLGLQQRNIPCRSK